MSTNDIQPRSLAEQLHNSLITSCHDYAINIYHSGDIISASGAELDKNARKLAAAFTQAQISQTPVLVLLDSGYDFIQVLAAAIYSGITIAPCPVPKKTQDFQRLRSIVNDTRFSAAIVHERDRQHIKQCLPGVNVFTIEALMGEALALNAVSKFLPPRDNVAIIQYSSGSTARPKGVLLSGQMILANFLTVANDWQFNTQHRHLTWLPHYHDMGLFGGLLYPILSGGWLMVLDPNTFIKRPAVWLKLISQYRVNVSGGPPFAYEICLRYLSEKLTAQLDLSCWSLAFCGADYIPATLKKQVAHGLVDTGFSADAFFACYGLAETVLFAGGVKCRGGKINDELMHLHSHSTLPCYLGAKHTNIDIFSLQDNQPLAPGQEGEICLSGPAIALLYSSGEVPSFEYAHRRWIRTGDIGIISGDLLSITGRIKDIIKLRGKTLYPIDFAVLANKLYPQLNPHVFLLQTTESAEILSFSIETYTHQHSQWHVETSQALQLAFNEAFGIFVRDVIICKRNTMDRTTSGKVQRWKAKVSKEQNATH
ncbi:AMP-binding protein [uncultured Alteromonas sp.]|jgi:acyl-CoA synthetase (AMP-forming)/AMP-acid ligase II|uniref:AMP-binding protein n=1 Tax=uncultured Alteromonas sp. TaxID=179113 RepID=UPI0025D86608|nr:AMP-binding protein [uncultured Alteromonas sp.]